MKTVQAVLVAVALSGCATSYRPYGISGGFSEVQVAENAFRVSFRGNGYTSREHASNMALLRSAELTLQHGYSHFVIIDERSDSRGGLVTMPTTSVTSGTATAYGRTAYGSATTTTYGGQTFSVTFPSSSNTILLFKRKPDVPGMVYDAGFVCNSLGKEHGVVCPGRQANSEDRQQ